MRLIEDLLGMIEAATRGDTRATAAPLMVWTALMGLLARSELDERRRDVASLEQAMHAWSAVGWHPSYILCRPVLLEARRALAATKSGIPTPSLQRAA